LNTGFVLVTGASGFVGRQLSAELARLGWKVRATFFNNGPQPGLEYPGVEWCQVSTIGRATDWSSTLDGGITHVIHLAAIAHRTRQSVGMPLPEYDEVNHLGTACLARQCARIPSIKRFLFVSSMGAVCSLSETRLDETTPCSPDTPYGLSKLAAEMAVTEIFSGARVEWCVLRPPLMYGKGNPGNMERLLSLMNSALPLPFGSVRNRRTFLFVGNFVDAVILALTHPAAANRLFCVADSDELSTAELILGLGLASHRRVRIIRFPVMCLRAIGMIGTFVERITGKSLGMDSAGIAKLCGSLSVDSMRFRSECGWRPPFSLQAGLRATVGETPEK
jgi:nucleoside-diphosphate-sugar epimerase